MKELNEVALLYNVELPLGKTRGQMFLKLNCWQLDKV